MSAAQWNKVRTIARRTAKYQKAVKKLRKPQVRARILRLHQQGMKARKKLNNIWQTAQFGTDPVQRDKAQRLARIVAIAANARAKSQAMASAQQPGLPGLFIGPTGKIIPGKFKPVLTGGTAGLVYRRKKISTGRFARVAGDPATFEPQEHAYLQMRERAMQMVRIAQDLHKSHKEQTRADKRNAVATMRTARKQGMSDSDLLRLAKELEKRVTSKRKARTAQASEARNAAKRHVLNTLKLKQIAHAAKRRARVQGDCISGDCGCVGGDCPETYTTVGVDCSSVGAC
jgi:hypothetical protein